MERTNLEKYLLSMIQVKNMKDSGIIGKLDYLKAESYLADKYGIQKGNLYRQIDLTIPASRVIDRVPMKEVRYEESNDIKHITQITKET